MSDPRSVYDVRVGSRIAVAVVTLLWLGAGCGGDACQMVVVLGSGMDVPADMDEIRVVVEDGEGALVAQRELPLTGGTSLPGSFGLVLGGSGDGGGAVRGTLDLVVTVPSEPFLVQADAMRGSSVVVSTPAVTSFVPDQTPRLDLFLAARCRIETCEAGQTCSAAGCADPQIDPAELPRWDG